MQNKACVTASGGTRESNARVLRVERANEGE